MSGIMRFLVKPPVEAYPLLAAVGGACGFATYMGYRQIVRNPDVNIMKNMDWQKEEKALENMHVERLRKQGLLPPL